MITRDQWHTIPVNERAAILRRVPLSAWDRYLAVALRLRRRFTRAGVLTISTGGRPAPFRILEDAAWMKYVAMAGMRQAVTA